MPHLTHPPFTYERQPQHRDHPKKAFQSWPGLWCWKRDQTRIWSQKLETIVAKHWAFLLYEFFSLLLIFCNPFFFDHTRVKLSSALSHIMETRVEYCVAPWFTTKAVSFESSFAFHWLDLFLRPNMSFLLPCLLNLIQSTAGIIFVKEWLPNPYMFRN